MRARSSSNEPTHLTHVPERPTNISVIEACSMFNPLNDQERLFLAEGSFMAYAERGEMIWRAGSPARLAAICGVGFVKMTRSTPHGMEVAVELLGPGQCFGLMAALEGRAFPLSSVAVTNCWYLKIPGDRLRTVYEASSDLKDQMLRSIGPRLRKAHEMMARMSTGKVEQRIAATLLILLDSYGTEDADGTQRLQVPLTRQDISEMAGTTVETTIRVMSRWQKEGVISTKSQIISVVDVEALNSALLS